MTWQAMVRIAQLLTTLLLATLLLAAGPAAAAEPAAGEPVQVVVGKSQMLQIDGQPSVIMVGNPAVADVVVETAGILFLVGLQPGETNLYVLDARGRTLLQTDVIVGRSGPRQVTVNRGVGEANLSCNPRCSPIANPAAEGATLPGDGAAATDGNGGGGDAAASSQAVQDLIGNMMGSTGGGEQSGN